MRWIRDAVTLAALVALCGISAAGAYVTLRQAWFGPVATPSDGVWWAFLTRDLSNESIAAQRAALSGLDRDAAGWRARVKAATPEEVTQLQANLRALAPLWLADESDRYFTRPEAERAAYLDQRIDRWQRLVGDVAMPHDRPMAPRDRLSVAAQLPLLLNEWIEAVEPARREQARRFAQALAVRELARLMREDAPQKSSSAPGP